MYTVKVNLGKGRDEITQPINIDASVMKSNDSTFTFTFTIALIEKVVKLFSLNA